MKHRINDIEDIRLLVDRFYEKVRRDDLIGPIFASKVNGDWDEHLDKMYRFWQTVLLGEHTYKGSPFPPHARLPIEERHFERWLSLFEETLNEHFTGEKKDEALWRAEKMAKRFQSKLEYFKGREEYRLQ